MAKITDLGAYAASMAAAPSQETVTTEAPEEATVTREAPVLDEWEYNLTLAALRQYHKFEMMLLKTDTPRERKRKLFNRGKIESAIHKMRKG